METENTIVLPHLSRFYVKSSEYRHPEQKENTWSLTKVEIFDKDQGDIKIGEYLRNYHNKGPFFPFKRADGQWFALYSEAYHRTYVMSLPSCEKVAECSSLRTENSFDSSGFCPLQYWVPSACKVIHTYKDHAAIEAWCDIESYYGYGSPREYNNLRWHHVDVGFVYGCHWGGEYYIRVMDLSNIESGVIPFSTPFYPCEVSAKIKDFSQVIEIYVVGSGGDCAIVHGASVNGKYYDSKDGKFTDGD